MRRVKKWLTHEVRSECADDPVAHLSSAPSSRSLATPTQLSCTATFSTVSCSSENLRREWGGHRNPMSLPPCPTTFCFWCFFWRSCSRRTSKKNPWDGQRWRRHFEPKIKYTEILLSEIKYMPRDLSQHQRNGASRRLTTGQGQRARGAAAPRTWQPGVLHSFRIPDRRTGSDGQLKTRSGED